MTTGTRQRLLDAAWRCLTATGPAGATSRSITAAAEANLGAITYHFGSKEELIVAAAARSIEALIAPALAALTDETVDPVTRMFTAIGRLQEAYASAEADAPAYLEVLLHARRVEGLGGPLVAALTEVRRAVAGQLAALQAQAFLPAWVDPDALAGLLLAVAEGVVLQTVSDPDGPGASAMADQFAHLLVAGRSS
jgi:AcrR family transcriptional regulator